MAAHDRPVAVGVRGNCKRPIRCSETNPLLADERRFVGLQRFEKHGYMGDRLAVTQDATRRRRGGKLPYGAAPRRYGE
jgi:hypothetical protein